MKVYAIYKGDKFIDVGTAKELSKRQKIPQKRIYWYANCNAWKNKKHKLDVFVVQNCK